MSDQTYTQRWPIVRDQATCNLSTLRGTHRSAFQVHCETFFHIIFYFCFCFVVLFFYISVHAHRKRAAFVGHQGQTVPHSIHCPLPPLSQRRHEAKAANRWLHLGPLSERGNKRSRQTIIMRQTIAVISLHRWPPGLALLLTLPGSPL